MAAEGLWAFHRGENSTTSFVLSLLALGLYWGETRVQRDERS